jgi:PE-PPE domain
MNTVLRRVSPNNAKLNTEPRSADAERPFCRSAATAFASAPTRLASVAAALAIALAMVVSVTIPCLNWVPAATVLMIGGLNQPTLSDEEMAAVLNGRYAGDTRVSATYPAQAWPLTGVTSLTVGQSVDVGIGNLEEAIRETNPAVVVGISEGSLVLDEVQRRLAAAPDRPRPDQIAFVTIAGLNRGNGLFTLFRGLFIPIANYTPRPEPVTPYHTTVIAKEYDGWADFPDRPWNLVATLNAIAGSGVIPGFPSEHNATTTADLSEVPDSNITTTTNSLGGITTRYLVPTPDLPLLQPLRDLGLPTAIVDAINDLLKPIVDAGYSRNDRGPSSDSADRSGRLHPADMTETPSANSFDAKSSTDADAARADVTSTSADADRSSTGSDPVARNVRPRADRADDASEKKGGAYHRRAGRTEATNAQTTRQFESRAAERASGTTTDNRPPRRVRGGCAGGGGCTVPVDKSDEPAQRRAANSDSDAHPDRDSHDTDDAHAG